MPVVNVGHGLPRRAIAGSTESQQFKNVNMVEVDIGYIGGYSR